MKTQPMIVSDAIASCDLIVSLDRSDTSVAVVLLRSDASIVAEQTVSTAPEALDQWWRQLQAEYPQARLIVAFEQPAPNLLAFFVPRHPAAIYALNPSATWAYRRSLAVSHARTDGSDARHQALFVLLHRNELTPWTAPAQSVVELDRLCEARRKFVDARTGITNRLQAVLKRYYPQALSLMHEDIWRGMNLAFLRRWPSPQALQASRRSTLKAFFRQHGSRSQDRWEQRAALLNGLVPLSDFEPVSDLLEVEALVDQLATLNAILSRYDATIARLFAEQPAARRAQVDALPGAGPILAPRVYVALARFADRCASFGDLAAAVGIAPITDQSGRMKKVYRRLRCDKHTRQTFVEWMKEAYKQSVWAGEFVKRRQAAGQGFHAILRALAYKWIRILWKCWHDGVPYDEAKYLQRLREKGSPLVQNLPAATAS
jgi:transposase